MVLVDADPAAGLPLCNVDDVLALHVLQRAGKLAGLTTVWGNSTLARVHRVAEELGQRWGVPVYRGAAGPEDVATAAVDALCAHTGDVLAIGPATNIAAALRRGARWSRLVVLGGTLERLNLRHVFPTERNFALDQRAAAIVLRACTTLVTMDAARNLLFGAAEVAALPQWLRARVAHWLTVAPAVTGLPGFHPHDLLPALFLVDPTPFHPTRRSVHVVGQRWSLGRIRVEGPGPIELIETLDVPALLRAWAAHA